MGDFHETEGEIAAVAGHASAEACNAEILARRATDEQVERAERGGALEEVVGRHVAEVRRIGKARGHHCGRELLDLGVPQPIELRPAKLGGADAGEARGGPSRYRGHAAPVGAGCANACRASGMKSPGSMCIRATQIDQKWP